MEEKPTHKPPIRKPKKGISGRHAPTHTIGVPRKQPMTRAEMYEDLRKAVENTK
jgi:hypothetical protein